MTADNKSNPFNFVHLDEIKTISSNITDILVYLDFITFNGVHISYVGAGLDYESQEIWHEVIRDTDKEKAEKIMSWALQRKFLREDLEAIGVSEVCVRTPPVRV